jgi:hypothetical protein
MMFGAPLRHVVPYQCGTMSLHSACWLLRVWLDCSPGGVAGEGRYSRGGLFYRQSGLIPAVRVLWSSARPQSRSQKKNGSGDVSGAYLNCSEI